MDLKMSIICLLQVDFPKIHSFPQHEFATSLETHKGDKPVCRLRLVTVYFMTTCNVLLTDRTLR